MTTHLRRPIGSTVPRMKVEVFNTLYSPTDAIADDVHANFDLTRPGWLSLPDWVCEFNAFQLSTPIGKKANGTLEIPTELEWMISAGMVRKCDAAALISLDSTRVDNQLASPSKLLVMVDSTGITTPDMTGTIEVFGTDVADEVISEVLTLAGVDDTLVTTKTFKTYTSMTITGFTDPTVSVWGDIGLHIGVRESRIVVDSNGDDIYGRVFGGYIGMKKRKLEEVDDGRTVLALDGYDAFLMDNEYVAGYRATHRCSHYSKTGEFGACSEAEAESPAALAIWRKNGNKGCWVGDSDTRHPDGTNADTYHCTDYDAGSEVLPYDGFTYYPDYCVPASPDYEPYPPSVHKAMVALAEMANSLESGKVTPIEWATKLEDYSTAMTTEELFASNLKSTIRATGESLAELATLYTVNNSFVFWTDPVKQVRLTELDLDNSGHDGGLQIDEEDIIGKPIVSFSGVVNDVKGWVTVEAAPPIYARMTAAETGFTDFDLSEQLFGVRSEEIEEKELNALAPTVDKVDFETYAKNYLKVHAFPTVTQTIEIGTFVPDENYWSDMIAHPYMDYTDTANKFIMIQGTKILCIDFSKTDLPTSTFIVTEVKYMMTDPGELKTFITMQRLTAAGEYK